MEKNKPMRILFALPGLHRVKRGAEVAFECLARELSKFPDCDVTLIGSGEQYESAPYKFLQAKCLPREKFLNWPKIPFLRNEFMYEELSFLPGLLKVYRPEDYDITVTCSYPYTNWVLRGRTYKGYSPLHVFVTENGDWAPRTINSEYHFFSCAGLVCTNMEYFDRHKNRWQCTTIPNGVDAHLFTPGKADREKLGLPVNLPIVLLVSALVPSKRVLEGIEFLSSLKNIAVIVAGNGPLAKEVDQLGKEKMGDRYKRVVMKPEDMPDLYRAANVLLHMSQTEPFGNIYLEALATGLPIVADDNEKTQWILEDKGYLVDTTNPEAVYNAVSTALNQHNSDLSNTRRKFVEKNYTWPIVAKSYYQFFRGLKN
jgi:glycosyltransferase involved in cell wall biosynthesis